MNDSRRTSIIDKLIKMEGYLQELKEFKPVTFEEFLSDKKTKYTTERLLQLVIDLALDINNLVIKNEGAYPASDYFNSFIELIELGVLDSGFAYKIAPSTGLRNRLVHEYEKVDDKIVYESIDKTYEYYVKYIKKIYAYLD